MTETTSIIVAVKDAASLLQELMTETTGMGLEATEIIVIDGASTDGTAAWLESVAPGGRSGWLSWESCRDSGIAEAWNRGVALARGDWLIFLGADDQIIDAAAWKAAAEMCRRVPASCGVVVFPVRIVSPSGAVLTDEFPHSDVPGGLRADCGVPHQGAFHRRSLWTTLGPFDESFAIAADYEFLLRVQAAGIEIRACEGPPPVAMTFGGTSKRSPLANLREFRRAQRMHGVAVPPLQRCREWCFAMLRHLAAAVCGEPCARRWADRARRLRGLPPVWEVP